MAEWSKAVDLRPTTVMCEGSNPSSCKFPLFPLLKKWSKILLFHFWEKWSKILLFHFWEKWSKILLSTFGKSGAKEWSHGVGVSTPDFESGDQGSNPCGTNALFIIVSLFILLFHFSVVSL